MWAIVPLKSPDTAKSRLAQVLSPEQRRALFFELARRVLTALQETSGISQVAVVTASEEVARFAQGFDAMILREPCDAGTAQAFAAHPAISDCLFVINPSDAPFLDPSQRWVAGADSRAGSVLERLVSAHGVSRRQLDAQGMGYLAPIASNLTPQGREANRRVEVIITSTE